MPSGDILLDLHEARMNESIVYTSASQMAQLIRQKRISAVELLEAHLERIHQHNPALNAIVTLDEDGARKRAQEADAALARGEIWGPLHGVPFTMKDAFETAGLRTTAAYPPLEDYIPTRDATAVARLRAAGAVVMGKTNIPELAMDGQTNNTLFGRTNNPWNTAYNPGGSTGGGAAALAAGLTPLELGSDIAGSVRLPSHSCGVYGIKPTEWRVPSTGHIPPLPDLPLEERRMNTVGPMARSVDDLELALRIMAGPDGVQWEVPPVGFGKRPQVDLKELRLAWTDQFGDHPPTRDTRTAVRRLVAELETQGGHLEPARMDGIDFMAVYQLWENFVSVLMSEEAQQMSVREYSQWMQERQAVTTAVNRALEGYDALICPVAMRPAFRHCPPGTPLDIDGTPVAYTRAQIWYTVPFNVAGNPAAALPLGISGEGLPIGVQVVSQRWQEMRLLAVAGLVDAAAGGFRIPPGYE